MAKYSPGSFANQGYVTVTQTAANTITFASLQSGLGLMDKVGWILHRLEFFIPFPNLQELQAATDNIIVGLTTSAALTGISLADPSVVTLLDICEITHGAVANDETMLQPFIRNFGDLPEQGLLIIPNPLYLGCASAGCAAAVTARLRYWYTQIELSDADYLSLVQSRRLIA